MLLVVFQLFLSPIIGFINGFLHGAGNLVGVHDDFAMDVAGSPADCLG